MLLLLPRSGKRNYYAREGFVAVALAWIVISLFGGFALLHQPGNPQLPGLCLETISGFTTTAPVSSPMWKALPKGLLYWRSFTHWLGGMGVLVFVLALQPRAKGEGQDMHLMRAESPGPEVSKLVPKVQKSAKTPLRDLYWNDPAANPVAGFGGNAPV